MSKSSICRPATFPLSNLNLVPSIYSLKVYSQPFPQVERHRSARRSSLHFHRLTLYLRRCALRSVPYPSHITAVPFFLAKLNTHTRRHNCRLSEASGYAHTVTTVISVTPQVRTCISGRALTTALEIVDDFCLMSRYYNPQSFPSRRVPIPGGTEVDILYNPGYYQDGRVCLRRRLSLLGRELQQTRPCHDFPLRWLVARCLEIDIRNLQLQSEEYDPLRHSMLGVIRWRGRSIHKIVIRGNHRDIYQLWRLLGRMRNGRPCPELRLWLRRFPRLAQLIGHPVR